MELDHSFDLPGIALNEGVGYYETIGYDEKIKGDITKFYVKKEIGKALEKKYGNKKIKVSPWFNYRKKPHGGIDIHVLNCAIVTKGRPRSELSGRDTSATRN